MTGPGSGDSAAVARRLAPGAGDDRMPSSARSPSTRPITVSSSATSVVVKWLSDAVAATAPRRPTARSPRRGWVRRDAGVLRGRGGRRQRRRHRHRVRRRVARRLGVVRRRAHRRVSTPATPSRRSPRRARLGSARRALHRGAGDAVAAIVPEPVPSRARSPASTGAAIACSTKRYGDSWRRDGEPTAGDARRPDRRRPRHPRRRCSDRHVQPMHGDLHVGQMLRAGADDRRHRLRRRSRFDPAGRLRSSRRSRAAPGDGRPRRRSCSRVDHVARVVAKYRDRTSPHRSTSSSPRRPPRSSSAYARDRARRHRVCSSRCGRSRNSTSWSTPPASCPAGATCPEAALAALYP